MVRSQYHMQLQQFLAHYPFEQILVIEQEELRTAPLETLRRVFEFTGVDPGFTHPHFGAQRHETSRKTRASRLAVRLERLSGTRAGRVLPKNLGWRSTRSWAGAVRSSGRTSAPPLDPQVLHVLREDAERLRELTGRQFAGWSIWDV